MQGSNNCEIAGLSSFAKSDSHKRKYTSFTAEDRAKVGKYASENGVAMARKHFKQLNLSESTVGYFRKKYLTEVAKRAKVGDSSVVMKVDTVKRERKVALGEARCRDQTIHPPST